MVERGLFLVFKFRNNALGQYFAQFDAPLVKRVNAPDRTLGEDGVLIQGNELAQRFRRELLSEDRVRRAVALKDTVGPEPVRCAFGLDLFGRFAEGQRLALSEDIGEKYVMVPATRGERLLERDEITGNEPGPLMDQLVERVLPVGARLPPVDGAGIVRNVVPLKGHMFAVALHRQLLEIGREALQVLFVRQHRNRLGAEEVRVPHGEEAQEHWQVTFEGSAAKMLVHLVEAAQQGTEVFRA